MFDPTSAVDPTSIRLGTPGATGASTTSISPGTGSTWPAVPTATTGTTSAPTTASTSTATTAAAHGAAALPPAVAAAATGSTPANGLDPTTAAPSLLLDEPAALPALLDAVNGAKSVIDISMYSWMDSGSGATLAAAVEAKARAGVEVNVMLDAEGSVLVPLSPSSGMVDAMRAAGVHVVVNHDLVGGQSLDHCKLYVIDGKQGFLGGMNLSAKYDQWHDAMVTLDESNVDTAGRDFLTKWAARGGTVSAANTAAMNPTDAPAPDTDSHVLINHPGGDEQVTDAYLAAINSAKTRVWVESPFVGSQTLVDALEAAAKRGVDVRVVTDGTGTNDAVPVIPLEGEGYYAELMAAGVKVYEQKQMTHSKILMTDDTVTAGSFNLTRRSQELDYEIDLQTTSQPFVSSITSMFDSDLSVAHQVTEDDVHSASGTLATWAHDIFHYQY